MKKALVLVFLFVLFLYLMEFGNKPTFAYMDCNNYILEPIETNTLNLIKYLESINYKEVKSFCSYDMCYDVRESDIERSINNFYSINYKKLSDDDKNIIKIKGFPITKIVINNC